MVKAIVTGAAGRMGSRIISIIRDTEGIELSGALERNGNPAIGKDAGFFSGGALSGISITSSLEQVIDKGDVVIDFTAAEASIENLKVVSKAGKAIVIGSTGFTSAQIEEVKSTAGRFPASCRQI